MKKVKDKCDYCDGKGYTYTKIGNIYRMWIPKEAQKARDLMEKIGRELRKKK